MIRIHQIHFVGGFLLFFLFLMTGQYMHHHYNHLQDMEPISRVLFRAEHIYILLFAMIHLALGMARTNSMSSLVNYLHYIGSAIVWLATCVLIYSFFTELPTVNIERPLCRLSLYGILAGMLTKSMAFIFAKNVSIQA